VIRNSVLMGADEYEMPGEIEAAHAAGKPPIGIGADSIVDGAIVDKNCRIGAGVRIQNTKGIVDGDDAEDCVIRDGIPIVVKEAVLRDGWQL
jgi:glucose-1-phosphate adenylyltransferase